MQSFIESNFALGFSAGYFITVVMLSVPTFRDQVLSLLAVGALLAVAGGKGQVVAMISLYAQRVTGQTTFFWSALLGGIAAIITIRIIRNFNDKDGD